MLEPPEGVNFRFGACSKKEEEDLGGRGGHGNERARLNGEGGDEITYHRRTAVRVRRTERENGDPDYNIRHRVHAESRKRGTTTSVARSDDFSANQTEKGNTVRQSNRATGNFRGGQSHAFLPRVKLTASFLGHFGLGWLIGNDKANPNRCFELFKWS